MRVWVCVVKAALLELENFTLPGLRFHTLQTRAFSSLARSHPCTPTSSPGPAPSSPGLARSSPVPRPVLARSWPGPRPALARLRFKQSSRQNGQKRNLLLRANPRNPEKFRVTQK